MCFFFRKVCFKLQKKSARSQKLWLTIPTTIRQHFWDIFCNPKNYAWPLDVQDRTRVDGQLIVRHNFWDPRNDAWQLSGNLFGIVRQHFWDLTLIFRVQKKPKQGNGGCFRVFIHSYVNLLYRSQHIYHVNHPFKLTSKQTLFLVVITENTISMVSITQLGIFVSEMIVMSTTAPCVLSRNRTICVLVLLLADCK